MLDHIAQVLQGSTWDRKNPGLEVFTWSGRNKSTGLTLMYTPSLGGCCSSLSLTFTALYSNARLSIGMLLCRAVVCKQDRRAQHAQSKAARSFRFCLKFAGGGSYGHMCNNRRIPQPDLCSRNMCNMSA